jgi:hypothetical protein
VKSARHQEDELNLPLSLQEPERLLDLLDQAAIALRKTPSISRVRAANESSPSHGCLHCWHAHTNPPSAAPSGGHPLDNTTTIAEVRAARIREIPSHRPAHSRPTGTPG